MLLSRPLIPPSPDFRRQIKALVPPGTVNTFSTPPREIMRARTYARARGAYERALTSGAKIRVNERTPSEGERRTEWRKNGTLLMFANDVPPPSSPQTATFPPRFWNDLSAPRQRRFVLLKWRYSRETIPAHVEYGYGKFSTSTNYTRSFICVIEESMVVSHA